MSSFEFQTSLENEFVKIRPLKESDFEVLYAVALDPLVSLKVPLNQKVPFWYLINKQRKL